MKFCKLQECFLLSTRPSSGARMLWYQWEGPLESNESKPCSGRVTHSKSPRTVSSWVLSISKDGDSTSPLVNLFQCSTTLTVKKVFFLCLNRISCVSVGAHCLWSCHWAPLRRAWLHSLYSFPIRYLNTLIRSRSAFSSPG